MMFRLLALIALTATVSWTQISGLATTDVGAQLYFSTPLRLRSAHRNFYPKILRYVGVFQPFREVDTQSTQADGIQTNFFRAYRAAGQRRRNHRRLHRQQRLHRHSR